MRAIRDDSAIDGLVDSRGAVCLEGAKALSGSWIDGGDRHDQRFRFTSRAGGRAWLYEDVGDADRSSPCPATVPDRSNKNCGHAGID